MRIKKKLCLRPVSLALALCMGLPCLAACGGGAGGGEDDLYAQAVAIVKSDKKTSISYVQRRLRIGYNKAATLIERMEEDGIISAPDHAGKREILEG